MGIDAHALHLLRYAQRRYGPLQRTLTLGRQEIHLGRRILTNLFDKQTIRHPLYCEQLLTGHFGASHIDAVDNSAYEGAGIIADLNKPLPNILKAKYDSVIDFGTIEHVYDIRMAMDNINHVCKISGRIMHVLPSNGFCGHGFYQFSPELFFSCYSAENGFANTEIFLAEPRVPGYWYKVAPPVNGHRITVRSRFEMLIIVITQKAKEGKMQVQQSDYLHAWNRATAPIKSRHRLLSGAREFLTQIPVLSYFAYTLNDLLDMNAAKPLNRHHPHLTRIRTSDLS